MNLIDKKTFCEYNKISAISFYQSVQKNKPVNPSHRLDNPSDDRLMVLD